MSDGTSSVSPRDNTETLNCYFSSVFVQENLVNVPHISEIFTGDILYFIDFTENMILEKRLNPSKYPGPDGWHPYFLRELATELSYPLSILFRKLLKKRIVPSDWLKAWITAIYKKGAKDVLRNYRPVSLTSVICKLFETLMKECIIEHMTKNGLLANEQHGFVPQRNCMTNLLTSIEDWSTMIDEGRVFDIIYTDFSKAFDSVPHARLITKLKALGIRGDILGWIEAFLTNRKQKVIVEGETSTWSEVRSGVPQGSVLGPILFVAFITDMPKSLSSVCKMFADDAKVYREMNCMEDYESLQIDLDIMSE